MRMIPGIKNIMFRYTFIVVIMLVLAILIIVKAGFIMFAERQYWKDVADRFVKENVVVPPHTGQHHFCRWKTDGKQPAGI